MSPEFMLIASILLLAGVVAVPIASRLDLAECYDIEIPIAENEPFKARYREMRDEWEQQLKRRMKLET